MALEKNWITSRASAAAMTSLWQSFPEPTLRRTDRRESNDNARFLAPTALQPNRPQTTPTGLISPAFVQPDTKNCGDGNGSWQFW
jgi:hypothetical protein